ncbi:hypothetical protein BGW42_005227 [Actinomortierella wolfii]|nr:hypothetical protein BGW42_005227 [Actinomortierella wolfii]
MRRAGSHSAYGSKGKCLAWSRPRLTFDRLPHEIKLQIFRYLSTFNLIRVTRVSRSWRALALDGSLWRVIDTTRYYRTIEDQQLLGLGRAAAGFLRYANFRGCTQLSSNTIRNIAEQCPNIRRLDLSGCRSISSKAIADVCMNLSHLVFLNTSGLDTVNNYTLQAIGVYCRSLQVLNIAHCRHISGSGVAKLARSCRELRDLNMAGCQGLDERHMMTIGMHLGKLRELCLNGCHSLTDRGILALLTGLASAARTSLDQKRSERFARALRGLGESSGGNSGSLSMEARIRQYYRRRLEAQRQGSQDMAAVVDDDEGLMVDDEGLMVDDEDESDFELEPVPWDPESESDELENSFAGMMDLEGTSDSDQETSTKTTAGGLQAPALLPVPGSTSTSTNNQSHNNNNISSNTATTNNDSNNNSGSFTRLTYLGLSNCRLLTNESLFAIGDQCGKTLERLELASCERLNDDGLIFLARHCERLRFIDLEDVRLLTDLTLREFALRLSRLERICLSNCENVTDQGVMQLFKGALVQQLNPPQPNGAANANLQPTVHRVGGSKQLVHIELDNCLLITDRLLLEFASAIEERRVQALERWRNMEDEQNKRRAAREMRRKRYLSRLERRKGKAKQTDPVEDASPGPSSFPENSEIMGDSGGSFERDISQDLSGVHMTEEMLVFESRRNSWAGPSAAGTTTKELGGGEGSATTSVGVGSGNCLSSSLSSSPGTIHSSPLSRSLSQHQQEGASPTSSTGGNGGVSTTCTCPCVLTSALSEATKVNQELHKNPYIRASLRALRQMPLPPLAWSWTSYALQRRYKMLKQRIQQRQIYYCQQVAYFQQLYQHHQRKQQQLMLDDELMFGNDSGLGLHQYDQYCTPSFNLAKQGLPPSILHRHPWMNQRRAIIQVFDCRNITLDGVEAALKKVQTRDFAIKSYYSWANPAIADPMGQQQQQQQQQRLTLGALISAFGGGNRQNSNYNNSNTNPLQSQSSGDTPFDYLDFAFDYNYSFPHDEEVDEAAAEEQETTNGSSGLGSVVAIYGTTTTPTAAADTTIASQHGLIHHASQASLQQHLQQSSQMNHGNTAQQAQSGGRSQRSRRHGNYPRNPPCPIL